MPFRKYDREAKGSESSRVGSFVNNAERAIDGLEI